MQGATTELLRDDRELRLSLGFSKQEHRSGLPSPPGDLAYFVVVFFFLKKHYLDYLLFPFLFSAGLNLGLSDDIS